MDGPQSLSNIVAEPSWSALAAPIYLGLVSTTLAYAAWNKLLHRYSASAVAPFALLAPCVGAIASTLFLGESFGPMRFAGIAVILVGIAIVALPAPRLRA
jgi:O-acetylserine/cysteine efflux transporter